MEWPDSFGVESSEMSGHLNDRERVYVPSEKKVNLVDESTCEPEDLAHSGQSGC
jgi:hypothetical protein